MNILEEFDTIAAPATPMGAGGVGIIRISGEKAFEIIDKIFTNPILNRINLSMVGLLIMVQKLTKS